MNRLRWITVLATLIALGTVGLTQIPKLINRSLDHHQSAFYMKLGNMPVMGPELLRAVEPFDYACFTTGWWERAGMDSLTIKGQTQNPKFQAGTYLTLFSVPDWMAGAPPGSILHDWYTTMRPYIAMTTEGDTAMIWPAARVVNYLLPGAKEAAEGVWMRRLGSHAPQVKFAMLDFASSPLPIHMVNAWPRYAAEQHGELDLDGDGISHMADRDEQLAWRQAMLDLVPALRRTAPGMRLIPNGSLAIFDDQYAKLVDGCYVEGFPQWFFGGDLRYDNALSSTYSPSMWTLSRPERWARADFTVVVEDCWDTGTPGLLAALWTGVVECRRSRNDITPVHPPSDLRWLGLPLAAVRDSAGTLIRDFEHGTIRVTPVGSSGVDAKAIPR